MVLGLTSCCLLAFVNQFFGYRQNHLYIGSISAQILVLPIGKLMAATLPSKPIQVPLTPWSFSSNPGPFNLKEHVLITIFTSCGSGGVYAVGTYIWWACLFRKYPVDSTYIWWLANLV